MDFQHPWGYDKMETYVPCYPLLQALRSHKSLIDFLERVIVKEPLAPSIFLKPNGY